MTRVAAVDIGTNSVRLLVADVAGGDVAEVVRHTVVTRLGEGVDAGRRLLPGPVARTFEAIGRYRAELEGLGAERTLAVATSAARDAVNGREFLDEVGRRFGFRTRLLTGGQEAELTRRGIGAVADGTLLLDVGGGSTELVLGERRLSLDVGSVRLTERYLHGDPPTEAELDAASARVRRLLPELEPATAIGVAGTVAQLRELAGELTLPAVTAELARLASMPVRERAALPGMDPARAPVIVGGAVVVREVLLRYDLPVLTWSRRDLLDGIALEAARPGEARE